MEGGSKSCMTCSLMFNINLSLLLSDMSYSSNSILSPYKNLYFLNVMMFATYSRSNYIALYIYAEDITDFQAV
jgi:hypothetical protein